MHRSRTAASLVGLALFVVVAAHVSAQNASQTEGPPPEPCIAAPDPEYALTPQKAVRIGGGPMYVAARQARYLGSLRGPDGQELSTKRQGTTMARTNGTPVDIWAVTWEGAETPITLYLDAYEYGEPRVPAGLTCAGFRLGTPPIDGFMSTRLQAVVAVEQGGAREFAPLSLDQDGSATHGVMFDRFRQIALAARTAAAAGTPLDPENLPSSLTQSGLVIVAFPKMCGGRVARPNSMLVGTEQGGPLKLLGEPARGPAIASLVPGYDAPEGSLAVSVPLINLRPVDRVRVQYDPALCASDNQVYVFAATVTPNKGLVMPEPTRPPGTEPPAEALWLQAVVDPEGRLVHATRIGGTTDPVLLERALATLRDWRAEPARINGGGVVSDTLLRFAFQ